MAKVELENVAKRFPDGTVAVEEVSLEIEDREFLVLVGPSGCGKSTTLRLIAGLEASTSGVIRIGGRAVTQLAPKDRDIAMVFQNYALYPHMSVYRNLSFGLHLRSQGMLGGGVLARVLRKIIQPRRAAELAQLRSEIDTQVRQTALRLGIQDLLDRKPHQLSGGERQRVALGRAIVRKPAAFLFDEPLSNLDAKLRQQMRVELKRLHRDLQATMIYVTHDQVEAMTLGDRVAVMNDGKILQVGRPLEIYQRPANLFVAKFIGSVPINLCEGTVERMNDQVRFSNGITFFWNSNASGFEQPTGQMRDLFPAQGSARSVTMGFRAEDVYVSEDPGSFEVEVIEIDRLGESTMVHTRLCSKSETEKDEVVGNSNLDGSILVRLDSDAHLEPGQRIKLAIDPNRVLWFDPVTGENLLKEH